MKPGELVANKYRIVDTVAVGGSGAVYRATRDGDDGEVALKLMHAEHPEGDTERQRFSREAAIIKKLQHPHVVRVLDYGHSDEGMPFLVFPLLQGHTLEERVKKGKLDWKETGRLSLQVLSALDKAHAIDIIHRDIKPANIFLCPSALGDNVQMLDFGLAKALNVSEATDVTRHGAVIGTPRYMAPEQVRGEQVGHTADIYAYGLVMAEMILGEPVVKADKELDIYMTHGSDKELDLPVDVMSSPFATVIRRAVAKPLEVRYRKASQMLADVRAVMEKLGSGDAQLAPADMEATFIVDPAQALPLSMPTEMSEKLRDAFNLMAGKDEPAIEDAPPTLRRGVPEPKGSVPLLLTRESDLPQEPEADTYRMERPDELKAALAAEAPRSSEGGLQDEETTDAQRQSSQPPPLPPLLDGATVVMPHELEIPPVAKARTAVAAPVAPPSHAVLAATTTEPRATKRVSPAVALLFLVLAVVSTIVAYLLLSGR